jgi:nuclear pore complex protein Nup93
VDEEEDGGLQGLADVLLGYGERHFDGPPGQQGSRRGVWAGVLLMCGQFERVSGLDRFRLADTDMPFDP